ncbi:MAG: MlaD family protein [Kofleriaceae bacterium]|nr:MlaD family protein [Kofleriaceae bacterium]
MRWVSRVTTFVVVIAVLGALALWLRSRVPSHEIGGTFRTWATFRDGSRLAKGSPVVIAGVQIGELTDIAIEGRFARVDMRLRDNIEIPADSFVTRRADSLFGDSYLEIIPTTQVEGAPPQRTLRDNEQLVHVIEGSSTDAVLRAMDRGLPKIDNALELMHRRVVDARKGINGAIVESMTQSDSWLAGGNIEGPIHKAHEAMGRVDELTTRGATALSGIAPDIARSLRDFEEGTASARTTLRDSRSGLVTAMGDTRAALDNMDPQIKQAAEIMSAISNGSGDDWKGSLGRLVNDPQLADDLEDAASAGREAVSSFYRFKSWLGMRVEYNVFSRIPRFYATAEIRARTDKFYLVEFEKGPLGGVPIDTLSDAIGTSVYTRRIEINDTLRFTAQFGKQAGRFAFRGGVKDSTFGFGIDVLAMSGRLKISTDVFGSFDPVPRLKIAAAFAVFRSIYVLAGVDDALNTPGYLLINNGIDQGVPNQFTEVRFGRDYFIGATLHFDDADLATLLRVYGAVLASALVL